MALAFAAALVLVLLAANWAGSRLRGRLHERHTTPAAIDSVRLMMGMLLTFAALVLGLLTSGAKQRFDGLNDGMAAFAADLVELDQRLRLYGPEADPIRGTLRRYTAAVVSTSWPEQGAARPGVEGPALGAMLAEVDAAIERLAPATPFQSGVASRLRDRAAISLQRRWSLVFASASTVSWPFLLILASWLAIIFAVFGMTAPPSRLVHAVAGLAALSIASPVFLILDYSEALDGLFQLSAAPMRAALEHIVR